MNKFDKSVIRRTKDLIKKNLPGDDVDDETFKKFAMISRAMLREESRGVKPSTNPNSLYCKTWKTAGKYDNFQQ